MTYPLIAATNGTNAQNELMNRLAAQGLAQPAAGLSLQDMLAIAVANLMAEAPAATVTPAALSTVSAGAADGLGLMRVARATFDPSANALVRPIAAYDLGVTLPINAVVMGGFAIVHTAFTSAGGNAGTIALSVQSANDLISAAAVSGAPYSTIGRKAIVPKVNTPESTSIELTAARALTATVATQALTAGKLTLVVFYIVGAASA